MGFLSRMLVPRTVRRAAHPVRSAKSAITPRPVKQLRRALNPIDTITYELGHSLKSDSRSSGPAYRHGSCPVRHRTVEAAQRCQNA